MFHVSRLNLHQNNPLVSNMIAVVCHILGFDRVWRSVMFQKTHTHTLDFQNCSVYVFLLGPLKGPIAVLGVPVASTLSGAEVKM